MNNCNQYYHEDETKSRKWYGLRIQRKTEIRYVVKPFHWASLNVSFTHTFFIQLTFIIRNSYLKSTTHSSYWFLGLISLNVPYRYMVCVLYLYSDTIIKIVRNGNLFRNWSTSAIGLLNEFVLKMFSYKCVNV